MDPQPKALIVEADEGPISHYTRALRGRFEVKIVTDSLSALDTLEADSDYPVVIADFDAPYMSGPKLFSEIGQSYPRCVRILTARTDRWHDAQKAVNLGNLFRLILKPSATSDIVKAIEDALKQHSLVMAEQDAVAEMTAGLVNLLAELLRQMRPSGHARALRLHELAKLLSPRFDRRIARQLEATAMMSQFGLLGVAEETVHKADAGAELSPGEQAELARQPRIAADLLKLIGALAPIVDNLEGFAADSEAQVESPKRKVTKRPVGSRLLRILTDYDELNQSGKSDLDIMTAMFDREGRYDLDMLATFEETVIVVGEGLTLRMLTLDELEEGMIVRDGIHAKGGNLVTGKNTTLTKPVLIKVRNYAQFHELVEPIGVLVPEETATT